jgi:glycerol uptake facilitator protein
VTLGLAVTGKFPWRSVPEYFLAQAAGATAGAAAIVGVLGPKAHEVGLGVASFNKSLGVGNVQGFFAEFIGTFILVFVIFGVIHSKATPGFAGVAIGFAVFAIIIVVAPTTSASINPARTIGPMLILQLWGGNVHWTQLPVYVLAELLAGAAAAAAFVAVSRTAADAQVPNTVADLVPAEG